MNENFVDQTNLETNVNQSNSFTLRIHKKLAVLLGCGLLFLVIVVGAYYLGKQSVNNNQTPYPTPTAVINQPSSIPTSNIPSITPTSVPISTYQKEPNITSVINCPSVTQNAADCNKTGCHCLRSIPPEGCPQGFIISCSQTNSNSCSTDSDCVDTRGQPGNSSNSFCTGKCVNKKCDFSKWICN